MMRLFAAALAALLLFSLKGSSAKPVKGFLRKSDIPDSGRNWMTLNNGVEFQPSEYAKGDARAENTIRRMLDETYQKEFVDGTETYYDEDAQAWRLLGFYIDCNSPYTMQEQDNEEAYRDLEEDYDSSCTRFLVWAAYIDPKYQGGGIGEYQQLDLKSKSWDATACLDSSAERCAKMDCHEAKSNYKLLGIFKEPSYDYWFEQLTQHQGSCVWSENDYAMVKEKEGIWPLGCTGSSVTDGNGNQLYFHVKPVRRGRIEIGLYLDSICKEDYTGRILPEDVMAITYGYGEEEEENEDEGGRRRLSHNPYSESSIEAWNDAFDAFKICQPCKAYKIDGSDCQDFAGSINANQCEIFASSSNLYTADFQDLVLATEQGTIVPIKAYGRSYGKAGFSTELSWSIICFIVSFAVMMASFVTFSCVRRKESSPNMQEPLVASDGVLS